MIKGKKFFLTDNDYQKNTKKEKSVKRKRGKINNLIQNLF